MRILLSAYACEPGLGSEEGVGWNMAVEIAKHHEVWVLTRSFSRPAIEAELARNPIPNLHFVYFEPLGWSRDWKGKQGAVQLHYYLWQIAAYFVGRKLHRKHRFSVTHHATYVKFWSPSFVSLLPIPFIWGPVGGGEAAPKAFWKDFSLRAKIYETLRDIAQKVGERDPFTRMTAKRSSVAMATTEDTARRLYPMGARKVKVYPAVGVSRLEREILCPINIPTVRVYSEAGLSFEEISKLQQYPIPESSPIRFISMGRLLHWKGYHLSIRAFLEANIPNAEYWLLGDGPERKRLQAIVEAAGATDRVKLFGSLPRHESLEKLKCSHVLLHPSLHDSGGWTCLEAMAAGRPVICLNLGGPAVQVTHETGIKVLACYPEQTVHDLAGAMKCLASDADLRLRMGQAGQQRVREQFDWAGKGQFFDRLYREVVAQSEKDFSGYGSMRRVLSNPIDYLQ